MYLSNFKSLKEKKLGFENVKTGVRRNFAEHSPVYSM